MERLILGKLFVTVVRIYSTWLKIAKVPKLGEFSEDIRDTVIHLFYI